MPKFIVYALFIVVVTGIGALSGIANAPGAWYQALQKPFFNPPSWIFGPVWTALYVLIAVAGARIWRKAPHSTPMRLWFAQMVLNFLWSPAFFGLQSPGLALSIIIAMLAAIAAFITTSRAHDRVSAALFLPYAGWVAFAAVLNLSILILN